MRGGFRLGRLFGVDVVVDYSLLFLAALLTWSLFLEFASVAPEASRQALLVAAAIAGVLFFASVLGHELSHSVLARRRGLSVKQIRLFIFGGLSEIESEASEPSDELAIALAGPISSAIFGLVFLLVAWLVPSTWTVVDRMFWLLGLANLGLAVFNLLPGFPLDGGRALRAFLWRKRSDRDRATGIAVGTGQALGLILLGVGAFLLIRRADFNGLWTIAIGWFLYQAAVSARVREQLMRRIEGVRVGDVMRRLTFSVPGDITVARLTDIYQVGPRLAAAPVQIDGRVRGLISETEIADLDEPARQTTLVASVMSPIGPKDVVDAGELLEALVTREAGTASGAVVLDEGVVVGILTGKELSDVFGGPDN